MSFSGILSGALEVIFLAALQRRFGAVTLLRCFMSLWPIIFILFPLTHFIARLTMNVPALGVDGSEFTLNVFGEGSGVEFGNGNGSGSEHHVASGIVWVIISVLLLLQRIATMAYPCVLFFGHPCVL